jgi:hypothetical protein
LFAIAPTCALQWLRAGTLLNLLEMELLCFPVLAVVRLAAVEADDGGQLELPAKVDQRSGEEDARSELLVGERPLVRLSVSVDFVFAAGLAARELRDGGMRPDVEDELSDVHASGPVPGLVGAGPDELQIGGLDADGTKSSFSSTFTSQRCVLSDHSTRVPCLPFRETSEMRPEIETRCRAMYPFALFDLGFVGISTPSSSPSIKSFLGRDKCRKFSYTSSSFASSCWGTWGFISWYRTPSDSLRRIPSLADIKHMCILAVVSMMRVFSWFAIVCV